MRNVDDLGLENPFQHFEESEQAASGWSSFGESPFASEHDLAPDSLETESLDWLDYEGEGQPCTCGASEAESPPVKRAREADFLGGRVLDSGNRHCKRKD